MIRLGWAAARPACVALVLMGSALRADAQKPAIGKRAPEIDLKSLDGVRMRLSDLRGHPVVVNFWATWCPPCRVEMPELIATYRKHHDAGLEVFIVNATGQETGKDPRKDVRAFTAELGFPFPTAMDVDNRYFDRLRLVGMPTTIFVDSAGIVRESYYGPMMGAMLTSGLATIFPAR